MTPRPVRWHAGLVLLLAAAGIAAGLHRARPQPPSGEAAGCELSRPGEDRPLTAGERACFERRGLSFATR